MTATSMILLAAFLTMIGIACYKTTGPRWTAMTVATFFGVLAVLWVGKAVL